MSRIRKFLLAVLFFAACSPSLEPLLKSQGQQGPNAAVHKIQVVIVAVPHFAIADYNDDVVRDAFNDQCTRLKTYFEQEFGRENVDVRPYCTTAKTTRESLRHLFSIDLPQFGAHTLTLIFIMSHGEEVTFGNGFLSSDLELITSDTFTSDDNRDSKGERQFSSILFGSELMSWLQRVPAGSTTLLFLDTCHSGAAASLSASLTGQLQQYFGLGSLVLASALPQNNTYKALFTKDLMSLWRTGNHCLNEDTLPNDIFSQMKAEAPLTNSEGLPRFIVRYNGPLCLGNFGKDRRLLFLYAGQSAQNRPFQYRITEAASHNIVVDKQQLPYVYLPIPLDAKKYTVNVERDGQELGPWNIDLSAYESRLIWLDQSDNDPKSVGKFGEVMVDTAERNGSSSGLVNALWVRTEAAYSIAGSERDVQRIKAKLKTLDAKGLAEARAAWSNNFPTHVASDASTNEMNGKFAQASNLWISAAEIDRSTNDKQRFAKHAYFDSIAAGDPKTAEKVQGTYKLDIPTGKVFTTSKTTVVTGWANILLDAAGEGLPAR